MNLRCGMCMTEPASGVSVADDNDSDNVGEGV